MPSVAVVGAGELGGSIAQALVAGGTASRVVLIDATGSVAKGKALDLLQAGAISGHHVRLEATGDPMAVAGCEVVILADVADAARGEWRGDDGFALLGRLYHYSSGAPLILAGPSQHELVSRALGELHVPHRQIFGSAPEALLSAVRAMVAAEVPCSPSEVGLGLVGRPGGWIIPWSEGTVGGYAITRVLTQARLARLEGRCAQLWPLGPTVLGLAAARAAEAVLIGSRRAFHVLTMARPERGPGGPLTSRPVCLGPIGIVEHLTPYLSSRDSVSLDTLLGD